MIVCYLLCCALEVEQITKKKTFNKNTKKTFLFVFCFEVDEKRKLLLTSNDCGHRLNPGHSILHKDACYNKDVN